MQSRHELLAFILCLAALVTGFFHESLLGGKVLSPADVLFVSASFGGELSEEFEPANALLMDPVIQFQPWLEFNRATIRSGHLPLWNPFAGCGAPHLANGQSAVFDLFHLIAYIGPTPAAYAWISAARLFTAGLGMFLLARLWGLGRWGRWFAGLVYPFTGFLVLWLLYPVTNVAIWMPWLFWGSERLLRASKCSRHSPSAVDRNGTWRVPATRAVIQVPILRHACGRSVGLLALLTAASVFGGHIQTTAHALLALGLYAVWKTGVWRISRSYRLRCRRLAVWSAAILLGLGLAAVQIMPLAAYLTRSPVWSDRKQELVPWWVPSRPRLLDAVCTALPYAYGSQRRDQPHLAPAVGVHNLNESAGGYVGLAALLWLAPVAVVAGWRSRRVPFLAGLVAFAFLAAFQVPPADNLLRLLPVLEVTDNRRLTLWAAFGLPLLAGIGLDRIQGTARLSRYWCGSWSIAAGLLGALAIAIPFFESRLEKRAVAHYTHAASITPGADLETYLRRAHRQVQKTVTFLPRYYAAAAGEIAALAVLAFLVRRNASASPAGLREASHNRALASPAGLREASHNRALASPAGLREASHKRTLASPAGLREASHNRTLAFLVRPNAGASANFVRTSVFALTVAELAFFGFDVNPAIEARLQTFEPALVTHLRQILPPGGRAIGLGEELPPNVLMRFGLADARNYDSVELSTSLDWFAPLYPEKSAARTSRREITWNRVAAARERLVESGVAAVVSASPPPANLFSDVERFAKVWIVRLPARPWADARSPDTSVQFTPGDDSARILIDAPAPDLLTVRITNTPGWTASIDGRPAPFPENHGPFLVLPIPRGKYEVILEYRPREFVLGLIISSVAALVTILVLTENGRLWIPGIIQQGLGRNRAPELG